MDPSALRPDLPGKVDFSFDAQGGSFDSHGDFSLALRNIGGRLRGVAASGGGTIARHGDIWQLDDIRLTLLEAELATAPEQPTILALHHPPLHTGLPPFDAICLDANERSALARVLAGHPQVLRVLAGHVHRIVVGDLAGRPVLTVPSTYVQARLDFAATDFGVNDDPPGFAVHAFENGQLTSHIQPLA